jgi:hypothetical protein
MLGISMKKSIWLGLCACLALSACVSVPTGPSVLVLPGTGRSFDEFRSDEMVCRAYAMEQNGGASAQQRSRESAATSAAVGTAVGAVAGAAVGGHQGAAVGGGAGLVVGSIAGIDSGQQSAYGSQRQYDNLYIQCMYAKGHRVPVPAGMAARSPVSVTTAPGGNIPPPPAGLPPAPPPR